MLINDQTVPHATKADLVANNKMLLQTPTGTKQLDAGTLMDATAENTLAGNVATAFDAAKPNDSDGFAYHIGDVVEYKDKIYKFVKNKATGSWDSSFVSNTGIDKLLVKKVTEGFENIAKVNNGKKQQFYNDETPVSGYVARKTDEGFICSKTGTGNDWSWFQPFVPDFSLKVRLKCHIGIASTHTSPNSPSWIIYLSSASNGTASGTNFQKILEGTGEKDIDYTFDPQWYVDNKSPSWMQFNIWFAIVGQSSGVSAIEVTGLDVYQLKGSVTFGNLSGETSLELFESVDNKLSEVFPIKLPSVENGDKNVYYDKDTQVFGVNGAKTPDGFTVTKTGSGQVWTWFNPIVPDFSKKVRVKCHIKQSSLHTAPLPPQWVVMLSSASNGTATPTNFQSMVSGTGESDVDFVFDPSYFAVYKDPPWSQFNLWFSVIGQSSGKTSIEVTNLDVYQIENAMECSNFGGENAKELFEGVDSSLSTLFSAVGNSKIVTSPNGSKFEISVTNAGTIVTIPLVPNKGAFFGNSLIKGTSIAGGGNFGMAASEEDKDYYHLIVDYIQNNINNSFTAKKLNSLIEGVTDVNNIASVVADAVAGLDGDEDLVVVQLGDNVNTPEKNACWNETTAAFIQAIRNKCPNARVVWIGMWFVSYQSNITYIQNNCFMYGATWISFTDKHTRATENVIGGVQSRGSGTRTLQNVSSVVENTATNIKITFSVSGEDYESTINVDSYSLVGTTLTYTGSEVVIDSAGVASHPNDDGMKAIANAFLYGVGYSQTENPIA